MEITRMSLTRDELECAVDLTERLVRLRQAECKHLCIENVGPEIYNKVLAAYFSTPLFYKNLDSANRGEFQPFPSRSEQS